jgi:endonuclease/exonuclease/phosphatase family metal-dependent hydrolase
MREAGFDDPGARLGAAPTSQDGRRIDYIFTSAGLDVREIRVFERWTSDHLPVTARMVITE